MSGAGMQAYQAVIADLRARIARHTEALLALEEIVAEASQAPIVDERMARFEIPPPAPAAERVTEAPRRGKVDPDHVRELHAQGLSDGKIAARLGVSSNAILLARRRLGLDPVHQTRPRTERVNAAASIVRWLRERGTIIAELTPGETWKVNGRDVIDRTGLLTMANKKRELCKMAPFAWEFEAAQDQAEAAP